MKKKLMLAVIAAACILVIGVGSTIAYFVTISGPVRNTFTVGDISLTLTETTGDEYRMIPGTVVSKDPHVTVAGGSEACWLYVKIEGLNGLNDYASYALADGWTHLGGFDGVYYRMVEQSAIDTRFQVLKNDQITINATLTEEMMAALNGAALPQMKITAYAIQTLGIDDASDGWYNLMSVYGSD